jgi:hypothetical protein
LEVEISSLSVSHSLFISKLVAGKSKCGTPYRYFSDNGSPVIALTSVDAKNEAVILSFSPDSFDVSTTVASTLLPGASTLHSDFTLSSSNTEAKVTLKYEKKTFSAKSSVAPGATLSSRHNFAVSSSGEGLVVLDTRSKGQVVVPINALSGKVVHVFEISKSVVLVVSESGLVYYVNVSKKEAEWVIDQSIATVAGAIFMNPVAVTAAEREATSANVDFVTDFKLRLRSQYETLLSLPSLVKSILDAANSNAPDEDKSKLFGFHQTIIVMSKTGRLVALSTKDGTTKWSAWLGDVHYLHPLGVNDFLLIGPTSYHVRDALTGKVKKAPQKLSISSAPHTIIPLVWESAVSKTTPVFVMSEDNKEFQLVPDSPDVLKAHGRNIKWVDVSEGKDSITGYYLNDQYKAIPLWSVALGKSSGSDDIFEIAGRSPNEKVSSQAKKLGNDGLLLKYLNPHLVGVIKSSGSAGAADVTLLDATAGTVLHRSQLQDVGGPVKMVITENWVVISYWNTKAKRCELYILTLHAGSVDKFELNPIKSIPAVVKSMALDGSALAKPTVYSQTYIAPDDIITMGVTATKAGISSKHILLGLASDSILALDLRFIDPRRPVNKPTADEQAEMLMQYSPRLPMIRTSVLSYNLYLPKIQGIVTAPASLESTSLVLSYGLDLFYTRYMPSNGFDVLPDSFNKPLLVMLTTGLSAGLIAAKYGAASKMLKLSWA